MGGLSSLRLALEAQIPGESLLFSPCGKPEEAAVLISAKKCSNHRADELASKAQKQAGRELSFLLGPPFIWAAAGRAGFSTENTSSKSPQVYQQFVLQFFPDEVMLPAKINCPAAQR